MNCYQKIIGEIIEVTKKLRRTFARPLMTLSLLNGLWVIMNLASSARQQLTALYLSRRIQCNSIFSRKKHPNKRSKKNRDGLYEVLTPGSVVQNTEQFTSVIREPGKLEVTVRNSDFAKFGTHDE